MLHNSTPQFAPVAPIQILEELVTRDKKAYGTYHLFLAHHTTEKDFRFRTLIKDSFNRNPYENQTIIMDNSIVELGAPCSDEMMAEACSIVKTGMTTVIPVLPDSMADAAGTTELSEKAYAAWTHPKSPIQGLTDGFMLVTQAQDRDPAGFYRMINHFFVENPHKYKRITWVGIPRLVERAMPRGKAARYIQAVAPHINIHFLGFSDMLTWDLEAVRQDHKSIKGIDSAVPVRYNGLLTPMTTSDKIGKRGNWWDEGQLTERAVCNIMNMRKWVS